jgi:hypothetical protein
LDGCCATIKFSSTSSDFGSRSGFLFDLQRSASGVFIDIGVPDGTADAIVSRLRPHSLRRMRERQ